MADGAQLCLAAQARVLHAAGKDPKDIARELRCRLEYVRNAIAVAPCRARLTYKPRRMAQAAYVRVTKGTDLLPPDQQREVRLVDREYQRRNWQRYELDTRCQRLVAEHPDGMDLRVVGEYLGITRERVRQIELKALRSLQQGGHAYTLKRYLEHTRRKRPEHALSEIEDQASMEGTW